MRQSGVVEDGVDGSHYVRSFGLDLLARFEDGEPLGVVHATMVRSFREPETERQFENGGFWGLVEFSDNLTVERIARLVRGDPVQLQSDPSRPPGLPVSSLVIQPVRDVRGARPRWLVAEIRD